jgi:hypothetical protein
VATDEFARFMWVRVRGVSPLPKDIYIVVCCFPLASSSYAILNGLDGDPFVDLYAYITQYFAAGKVVLLGELALLSHSL